MMTSSEIPFRRMTFSDTDVVRLDSLVFLPEEDEKRFTSSSTIFEENLSDEEISSKVLSSRDLLSVGMRRAEKHLEVVSSKPDDIISLVYTSGSTGKELLIVLVTLV